MDKLLFRRQFIAGPDVGSLPDAWRIINWLPSLAIAAHPDLPVARAEDPSGSTSLVCLGDMLNSEFPSQGNADVLGYLLAHATSFAELQDATAPLGGRWLLFARLGHDVRLYPDAAGTRSVFYARDEAGRLWAASQPLLLKGPTGRHRDQGFEKRFLSFKHGNSWPGDCTPFPGVRQLLPNRYLDLHNGQSTRFAPVLKSALSLDAAVSSIHHTLAQLIRSAAARSPIAIPLTAGYDSRALFAAAGTLRSDARLFCIADPSTPHYETAVPRRLGRAFGVPVHIIQAEQVDAPFWEIVRRNVCDMHWDPGENKLFTFYKHFEDSLVLTGGVGELGRCFYYENGVHPSSVTPELLADFAGYSDNPIAIRAFADWLAEASTIAGLAVLDLFYWEHRVGNWLAMAYSALDTACNALPVYNCRLFIETAVVLDVNVRREPYELFRRICELGAPASTRIPFNESLADHVFERLRKCVPWRVRHQLHHWRMRKAGLVRG